MAHRAAELLGSGRSRVSVAAELGIDPATISRWRRDADFRQLEQAARERHLDAHPSAHQTLEAALSATDARGLPKWETRVAAARALLGQPADDHSDEPVVIERRILVDRATGEEVEAA